MQHSPLYFSSYTSKFEQFSVLVAMADARKHLLDVQIGICMFLYPSDILALRMVCRLIRSFRYSSM
jgi:hypothetical protein